MDYYEHFSVEERIKIVELYFATKSPTLVQRQFRCEYPGSYPLAKIVAFSLVGLGLRLKNLHFVGEQFQVAVNDSLHRSPGNRHLL